MAEQPAKQNKLSKVLWICCSLTLIVGMVVPQSVAAASPMHVPAAAPVESELESYSIIQRDYNHLKSLYARKKNTVKPLAKGLNILLQNYRTLQNRGNKKWVDMRVLYYDYNSYYQAAISHQYEVELLLQNHYGFDSKGKITSEPMAKYTVTKLRGAVVQMIDNVENANKTLQAGKKLMKINAVPDKGKNK